MLEAILPIRQPDKHGDGKYKAPRGQRTHNGIDYACHAGTGIKALSDGVVSKVGYPYADDLSFRYIEVTDLQGYKVRYFYLDPYYWNNDKVKAGDILGSVQTLQNRYPGITDHCHLEIMDDKGNYIDPSNY